MRPLWSARPRGALLVILCLPILAGCLAGDEGTEGGPLVTEDPSTHPLYPLYADIAAAPEVRFETDHGTIRMLLYTGLMPVTTARFQELVAAGFYDGTIVHRVVDDFVIQGGDASGTGMLGSGETIPFESHPDLQFGFGALGLARDLDPDSGDSQWFVTERPQPHLHAPSGTTGAVFGNYALYGQVFEGMAVVRSIAAVDTIPGMDRPVADVALKEALLLPPPVAFDPLAFPKRLEGPYTIGPGVALVERPLHVFAGHGAPFVIELEPNEDGATAPATVTVTFGRGAERVDHKLPALADDPWVFHGTITLGVAGEWEMTVAAGGVVGGPTTIRVEPLGPALAGLLRADA